MNAKSQNYVTEGEGGFTFSPKFEPNLKNKTVARFMSEHGVYYFLGIFDNVFKTKLHVEFISRLGFYFKSNNL